MWSHLDRVAGGGQVKGAGEKQIEIDKRLLRDKAAGLRRWVAVPGGGVGSAGGRALEAGWGGQGSGSCPSHRPALLPFPARARGRVRARVGCGAISAKPLPSPLPPPPPPRAPRPPPTRELQEVRRHRAAHRERRGAAPIPVVALVGYTNAGKSTLLNTLTQVRAAAAAAPPPARQCGARGRGLDQRQRSTWVLCWRPLAASFPVWRGRAPSPSPIPTDALRRPRPRPNHPLSSTPPTLLPPQAGVLAEDKLFATLDPTTRKVRAPPLVPHRAHGRARRGLPAGARLPDMLSGIRVETPDTTPCEPPAPPKPPESPPSPGAPPRPSLQVRLRNNLEVLFSDTVGFIQKLPPQLVAAFTATLEEIADAGVVLHVLDASAPNAAAQCDAVLQVGPGGRRRWRAIGKAWGRGADGVGRGLV
jgi:hypothetical protein